MRACWQKSLPMLVSGKPAGGSESKTFTAIPCRRACSSNGRSRAASSRSMVMPVGRERIAAARISACAVTSALAGARESIVAAEPLWRWIIAAAATAPPRTASNHGWPTLAITTKRSGGGLASARVAISAVAGSSRASSAGRVWFGRCARLGLVMEVMVQRSAGI